MNTNYLPYDLFSKAMSFINWHDTVESENGESVNYRPYGFECSIDAMIDLFVAHPYVKGETYFVASSEEKGNVSQSFAQFYASKEPKFIAMCYCPKMKDIHTILPIGAFARLPEELWQERSALPASRYDDRDEVSIKDGENVVYFDNNGLIRENRFELRPTFGGCIRDKVSKVMTTKVLRAWLSTKDGKAFQQRECLALLEEKAPMFYKAYTEQLTGEQIIQSLLA